MGSAREGSRVGKFFRTVLWTLYKISGREGGHSLGGSSTIFTWVYNRPGWLREIGELRFPVLVMR